VVRVVMILLTIGGIVACPLVCRDYCHEVGPGDSQGDSDPCHAHSCVCKGAVQPPHDPEPDAAAAGAADATVTCPAAALPQAANIGVEVLSRCGDGPPRTRLESGRVMRLVYQSLVL
jgi:hypothetical protein